MTISKGWFVILRRASNWLAILSAILGAGNLVLADEPASSPAVPSLVATLSSPNILVGERATVELRLHGLAPTQITQVGSGGGGDADSPGDVVLHDELLAQLPQLKVLNKDFKRDHGDLVWRYDFTSYELGRVSVPPFAVNIGAESYSSVSLPLVIRTGRSQGDEELRPEFGRISPPWRWKLIFLGLFLLAAIAGTVWAVRKYLLPRWKKLRAKLNRPEPVFAPAPTESDEEWLRRQLRELRERLGTENTEQLGALVDAFTGTLRQYFARRTRSDVTAWTTPEFQKRLARDPKASATGPVLIRCDEVKFSGRTIPLAPLLRACLDESEKTLLEASA